MDKLFDTVLELSWQAGLIALAVMVVRLLLRKRASRRAVCLLWALVALRLVLPVSLTVESPVSLQPQESPATQVYHQMQERRQTYYAAPPEQREEIAASAEVKGLSLVDQLPAVWLTGVGCMALYMFASLLRMRWRLRRAVHVEDNVYRCSEWGTPFVLGVFTPRIYVPENVPEEDMPQVLAHERCHIRRWDHVCKPLAFLLLAVNWFNPVLWAAYILLGRDMENACDEMALKDATPAQRAAYSRALVFCAAMPKMAAVCPLAFGEVAVKERVKNVLKYKKPALWAAIMLVIAAVIIGVCLMTKPAQKTNGALDAESLYALRTPYVGNPADVGAILDALDFPALGSTAAGDTYTYSLRLDTNQEPMGVTVCYAFAGAVPERSAEWNRQMARRGYIAMALIDNIDWFRWTDIDQADTAYVTGVVYSGDYVDELNAARESAEGLQAYLDTLRAKVEDGSIVYYPGDAQPSFEEITPWPSTGENDPVSADAEDYGILYDEAHMPSDWETVPLSWLCAYYLNADGAYAEGAMDVLAKRYMQAPNTVEAYIQRLSGRGYGDAAERLLRELTAHMKANYGDGYAGSGEAYSVEYEKDGLKLSITQVYAAESRTVTYDENYSEEIPVYEIGSGAKLSVIKGEGWTLYGRYNSENAALHDGDVIDLTEQYTGIGMDGAFAIAFQHRNAAEMAAKTTLSFNDNGEGMVGYSAYIFVGSGYTITILEDTWHQLTLNDGWPDLGVDGSPAINGKPAEVWQSTEDINAQLAMVHLGAMTLKDAQEWAKGAAGDGFTLTESKQGDMSGDGKNGPTEMYWTCAFYGTDSDRLAVIKTYPVARTEHLGYALNAMADTFTLN